MKRGLFTQHAPWLWPCMVGATLRIVAALTGFGWFAPDDYEFAIQQGGDWLAEPNAPFTATIRSPLLSRLFWWLLRASEAVGLTDPATRLQGAYALLGLWSVLAIPAVWALTRRRLGDTAATQAAWLMAAYALIPRISTRALIEVLAIPPLAWGLVALDGAMGFWAGLLLGGAALLRFQLGILFLPWAARLLWQRRALVGFLLGSAVAAGVQAGIDASLQRRPFATILNYLAFNKAYAAGFSTSPWYTYLGHFALYAIPPATVLLAKPLWRAARAHPPVALSLGWFVGVHSLIGHKEDRFMYSVLPLFFVLLGSALATLRAQPGWGRRAYGWFWAVNTLALAIAVSSDAQRNLTVPLLRVARTDTPAELAAVGYHALPRYYAGPKTRLRFYPDVATFLREHDRTPQWILLRHTQDAAAVAEALPPCSPAGVYAGDFADRLVLWANPRRNGRRAPTALLSCPTLQAKAE